MEWTHASLPYRISDDKALLDADAIHALLQTSYWAPNRSRETVVKSIEGSLCFGIYYEDRQVGFARSLTDGATTSWLCDVIIHPDHRGRGLGKWLMAVIVDHPMLKPTGMGLATRDAHGLYEKFGFVRREAMNRPPGHSADS